ncbi:unnamed protein product [Spirodela intermedia]|uniref:MACPF domain-containing protein n=1 Tax=Spirodela intermedia TaxID=51605 RepID=A0A7I8IPD0_SPIIN|nr:unnamed protein product [Spirodela intermedia]CAA6659827.1 unnamed protein product [Spirodela intermedia]
MGDEGIGARAVRALGTGFDLASDFRLRFAKGYPDGARLVQVEAGGGARDLTAPGGEVIREFLGASGATKGAAPMSELLNQKSSIQGKIPSGYFNALFEFSGAWLDDAMDTKYLAFDGYFISLYNLHLTASPLVLREEVKKAVPPKWEPLGLSRFIKTYGTHILVGMAVGGQDVICIRQKHKSSIPSTDLKLHLEDLGDHLFSDERSLSPLHGKTREGKQKVPEVFRQMLQSNNLNLDRYSETSSKDGLVIIRSKRGGNTYLNSHNKWLQTVSTTPDAIFFKFVPITSLLTGVPGSGYLSHAINLYLRCKQTAFDDLQYFLEFQVPQQWAPMFNELALGLHRRQVSFPTLQFRCFGPKLDVNTTQVLTDLKPVTGLRLYLEGKKCNRLAMMARAWSSAGGSPSPLCRWRGNEDADVGFLEPIQWKRYAHVCTASVKHDPDWLRGGATTTPGVFVVTGAQLVASGRWPRKALHLRLLFTLLPGCAIRKKQWAAAPAASHKSTFLTMLSTTFTQRDQGASPAAPEAPRLNSGVFAGGPPVPVLARRLLRFIDVAEVVRGPQDVPGHWVVTAAKLVKDGKKIGLHVKFTLLHYPTPP